MRLVEAYDAISNNLMAQGMTAGSKEFEDAMAQAWKDNNIYQQILLELHHLLSNDLRFRTIYALSFFIFICNYHQLKYFKTKGKNISSLLTK